MTDWTLISDEDLTREYWRRMHARRSTVGGRPVKLRRCPKCKQRFPTAQLRAHKPYCQTLNSKDALEAARKLMQVVRTGREWSMATASGCLPPGWGVSTLAQDSDFHPCTVRGFTAAFRAYARPTKGDAQ